MPNYDEQVPVIREAAKRTGVPFEILWGVYGVETSHGRNVSTSSAGAEGAWQFLQSTAREWSYPYTNQQDLATFKAQTNAAANYLASLYHAHGGNWDAALRAYSGRGYGLSEVQKASETDTGVQTTNVPLIGDVVKGSPLAKPIEAAEKVGGSISEWVTGGGLLKIALTIIFVVGGVLLAIYGIAVAVRPRESAFSVPAIR